jgi:hypothetical protein
MLRDLVLIASIVGAVGAAACITLIVLCRRGVHRRGWGDE